MNKDFSSSWRTSWKHHFFLYLFIAGISFIFRVIASSLSDFLPSLLPHILPHFISLIFSISSNLILHAGIALFRRGNLNLRGALSSLISVHACVSTFTRQDFTKISFFVYCRSSFTMKIITSKKKRLNFCAN